MLKAKAPLESTSEELATGGTANPVHAETISEVIAAAGPSLIACPLTCEVIDTTDVDALIDCYERVSRLDAKLYDAKVAIRHALADMTEGDAKTRRVRGKRRQAKVEFPSDSWDQSILRQAWQTYPQFRDEFLKIGTITPKAVECRKLAGTSGPAAFESFRDMVTKANRGSLGLPTITIET